MVEKEKSAASEAASALSKAKWAKIPPEQRTKDASRAAQAFWNKTSPRARSKEMKRRAKVRWDRVRAEQKAAKGVL